MKAFVLIVLSYTLCSFSACRDDYPGEPLNIGNNSDNRIYYWHTYWKYDPDWTLYHYPNTIPDEMPKGIHSMAGHAVVSGPYDPDPDWVKIFSELPEGKFTVYFFTEEPKTQKEWTAMKANNAYYRKDVTLQELKDNNYRIYYP